MAPSRAGDSCPAAGLLAYQQNQPCYAADPALLLAGCSAASRSIPLGDQWAHLGASAVPGQIPSPGNRPPCFTTPALPRPLLWRRTRWVLCIVSPLPLLGGDWQPPASSPPGQRGPALRLISLLISWMLSHSLIRCGVHPCLHLQVTPLSGGGGFPNPPTCRPWPLG